jgi:hypothetical protein
MKVTKELHNKWENIGCVLIAILFVIVAIITVQLNIPIITP